MADETTTTPNVDAGNVDENPENTSEIEKRLQNQSAILGKVVNASNNYAKDLEEIKTTIKELAELKSSLINQSKETPKVKEEEEKAEAKTKTKLNPDGSQQLTFEQMQQRLQQLEEKGKKKTEAAKRSLISRSLERNGVDPKVSDKVTKMLLVDLAEKIEVDDSGPEFSLAVQYEDKQVPAEDFLKMWLESDEGSVFKSQQKQSPSPKIRGSEISGQQEVAPLNMIDFAKKVAEQYRPGAKKEEARTKASNYKLQQE